MKSRTAFMSVSLPAQLRDRLDKKVERLGAFSSTSEYIRDLIRRDLDRDATAHLEQLLLEGVRSGPGVPVTEQWWKDRRAALATHRRARAKQQRKRV